MTIVNLHPGLCGGRNSRRALLAVVAAALAFAYPAGAQEPDALSSSEVAFGEEIDVRVVNIEVVVEDGEGERVRDLRRDDFRVFVDGEEVDVEYFTEVAQGRASDDNGETPPAVGEGGAVATNFVLFVDDDHSLAAFRRPVLRGFSDSLAELPVQDQVAVVVQSRNRLELLSPFTRDREATRTALAELDRGERFGGVLKSPRFHQLLPGGESMRVEGISVRKVAGSAGGRRRGRRVAGGLAPSRGNWDVRRDGPGSGGEGGFERADAGAGADGNAADRLSAAGIRLAEMNPQSLADEAMGSILERDLTLSVNAVVSAMRALEQPEGRRVLLLLAGRWPAGAFRPGGRGSELRTDLHLLDALIDTANLLGYTVYPMDQQGGSGGWLWANMRYVARGTGGRAFMAGSNVRALEIVNADTSDYYWLGFVPGYLRDDRAHDVRIEVREPRLRVRSRRGYLDLSRRGEADMEALRELLFPAEAKPGGGPLLVEVGAAESVKRSRMNVPITVYLPVGRFPALPYDGQFVQDLEVRFAAVDRVGRRTGAPVQHLRLGGASLPAADDVVLYRTSLSLRRLSHDVVVTVHDPLSRETASARMRVAPEEVEPNP